MTDTINTEVIKRLNLMLSLSINPIRDSATEQEKIQRLDSFGFTPAEIAIILGYSSDKVSKQLYVIRNKNKK